MSLNVSAIFPARPVQAPGRRTEKSPSRMECKLARISGRSTGSPPACLPCTVPLALTLRDAPGSAGEAGKVGAWDALLFIIFSDQARNYESRKHETEMQDAN